MKLNTWFFLELHITLYPDLSKSYIYLRILKVLEWKFSSLSGLMRNILKRIIFTIQ